MKIRATATIAGAKTNRVRMGKSTQSECSVQRAMIRYRKDPTVYGLKAVVTCISMPTEELAALDELAEELQMARSHLIRAAVKQFMRQRQKRQEHDE